MEIVGTTLPFLVILYWVYINFTAMKEILEKLTKEDLIKVIANMHDIIQDWNNEYGLSTEEFETLIKISSACVSVCSETQDWNLPKV